MPGVPTSSGCDACRRAKKKCDQAKPACFRCQRLRIPCLGAGIQRYKFLTVDGRRGDGTTRLLTIPDGTRCPSPVTLPHNAATGLSAEFMHKLNVRDVRYDLCFTYGPLLKEIPKRLGESAALDSSISALVATVNELSSNQHSQQRIRRYGIALSRLRMSLEDPHTAFSSLTLCAILIIWICQGWLGGDQSDVPGHGKGVLAYLSRTRLRFSNNLFDQQVLGSVLGPVMYEAAFDSSLKLDLWMKEFLIGNTKRITVTSCLLRLPEMIRYDPSMVPVVSHYFETVLAMCQQPFDGVQSASNTTPAVSEKMRSTVDSSLAMNSAVAITLNGVLLAYRPNDAQLCQTLLQLHKKIIHLATRAEQFMPLAASWMPIALELAWVAQTDPDRRNEIEKVWTTCWTGWSGVPFCVSTKFARQFENLRVKAAASNDCFTVGPIAVLSVTAAQ